nr:MAG TPA: hypothetical protein [Caudoviricetes sp.]
MPAWPFRRMASAVITAGFLWFSCKSARYMRTSRD